MKSFYEQYFEVIEIWNKKGKEGVMFKVADTAILELLAGHPSPMSGADLSLEVADVHKLWERFKDYDKVVFKLRENNWGDVSFCIADPEGFKITFFTKIQEPRQ